MVSKSPHHIYCSFSLQFLCTVLISWYTVPQDIILAVNVCAKHRNIQTDIYSKHHAHNTCFLADFHTRRWRALWWRYHSQQGCQMASCSLNHSSGYFYGHLGTFPSVFVRQIQVLFFRTPADVSSCFLVVTKTYYFSWEVRPSPSVFQEDQKQVFSAKP